MIVMEHQLILFSRQRQSIISIGELELTILKCFSEIGTKWTGTLSLQDRDKEIFYARKKS